MRCFWHDGLDSECFSGSGATAATVHTHPQMPTRRRRRQFTHAWAQILPRSKWKYPGQTLRCSAARRAGRRLLLWQRGDGGSNAYICPAGHETTAATDCTRMDPDTAQKLVEVIRADIAVLRCTTDGKIVAFSHLSDGDSMLCTREPARWTQTLPRSHRR